MELKFYREEDNRWYVDLPEWEGSEEALEMVAGADALCDVLAHNTNSVVVEITEALTENTKVILHRWMPKDETVGAFYRADFENSKLESFDIWLCPVTEFVFDCYPDVIYIQ
jgi:hypothetical protein